MESFRLALEIILEQSGYDNYQVRTWFGDNINQNCKQSNMKEKLRNVY